MVQDLSFFQSLWHVQQKVDKKHRLQNKYMSLQKSTSSFFGMQVTE